MKLDKALAIIDAKFSVPLHTLKVEFRDLVRRAAEEMFVNVSRPDGSHPFRVKDKLNEWINNKADQYLLGYDRTLRQADIDDFEVLEKQLHEHFLKAMDGYYSEACHTLYSSGSPALTMHLQSDYENMKRGKLADLSLLAAEMKNEAMKKYSHNNITYNLTGANARVNINSRDYSINVANAKVIFDQVREAAQKIDDQKLKDEILASVQGMESVVGKPAEYLPQYSKFMSLVANHVSVFANLIPALTQFLG